MVYLAARKILPEILKKRCNCSSISNFKILIQARTVLSIQFGVMIY